LTLVSSGAGAADATASAPWLIHKVPMAQPSVVPPGAVDIDDLLAEFEATPNGAKAVAKGRQWVAKTFYGNGASLAALRLQHGWSQAELARRVGTSQSYIGRLETGGIDPQLSTIRKIATALGVPVTALVDALTPQVQA
jgi:DNA-binding XRE family transcriptional regulator